VREHTSHAPHKTTPAPSPQVLYIGHDVETQCSSCARCAYVCSCLLCVWRAWPHTTVGRHRAPCYVVRPASRHWHARTSVCVPTNRVPLQTALKRRANVSSCVCMCEGLQRIGGAGEKGLTPRPHHPKDKQTPSHKPTIRLAYDVVLPCNNDQKQSRLLGKQQRNLCFFSCRDGVVCLKPIGRDKQRGHARKDACLPQ